MQAVTVPLSVQCSLYLRMGGGRRIPVWREQVLSGCGEVWGEVINQVYQPNYHLYLFLTFCLAHSITWSWDRSSECDRKIAVNRLWIINIIMTVCCHKNHLSPRLVLIQRILLITKTTKLCLSDCAHKHTKIWTEILKI